MKSYQEFFAELKRRKVFRVAAVYGVTAFVLLQVADLLVEALKLPADFLTMITVLMLLGFPVALILAWAFEMTPDGVRKTGAAAAGEIEGIVAQPLSKRWPAGLMALVGVAALVAGAWWAGRQSSGAEVPSPERAESMHLAMADVSQDDRPSIAVLPFVNMSADEDQEYFSDGMTEEILNSLANIQQLRVSGRTSAFAYKGRNVDLRQIGSELGVRYLLEGSVRKSGERLRITAQLIDATDGSHLWSDQYDRRLEDVFVIQTDIATAIADALTVPLGLEPDEALVTPTGDLAAYDLYLAGRRLMRQRGAAMTEAIRLFQAAVDRDSTWAPAWAALAEATEISIWYPINFDTPDDPEPEIQSRLEAAERAANRALALDPRSASALVALGSVMRNRGKWDDAEETYQRAIAIDPDNAEAHQQYGELLGNIGRIDESVRALDRAVALDPAPVRVDNLAFSLERDGRADEALRVYREGLRRDRDLDSSNLAYSTAFALARVGQVDEATSLLSRWYSNNGAPRWVTGGTPSQEDVRQLFQGVSEQRLDVVPEHVQPLLFPGNRATMGDTEGTLASLVGPLPAWIPDIWQPELDSLRALPEFQQVLANAGLAGVTVQRTPPAARTRPQFLRDSDAGSSTP